MFPDASLLANVFWVTKWTKPSFLTSRGYDVPFAHRPGLDTGDYQRTLEKLTIQAQPFSKRTLFVNKWEDLLRDSM